MHVLKVKATVDHWTKISCTYTAKNKSYWLAPLEQGHAEPQGTKNLAWLSSCVMQL